MRVEHYTARGLLAMAAVVAGALGAFAQQPCPTEPATADAAPAARLYATGGTMPLPPASQQLLDDRVKVLRLGINTDRLVHAGVCPRRYVEAVAGLADEIRDGAMPGAVVFIDGNEADNMPLAVGSSVLDPEAHDAEWATMYELGELTGVVVTVPMALRAIQHGDLMKGERLGALIPELTGSDKAPITIEMLLHHASGLPERPCFGAGVRTRAQLLAAIRDLPLDSAPGTRCSPSALNFLLLGLVLEQLQGEPVQSLFERRVGEPLGMVNTAVPFPATWRQRAAPGPYSDWHGRMVWAEASEPSAAVLGPSAGNGGVISTADDVGLMAKLLLVANTAGVDDFLSTETMRLSLQPCTRRDGGENVGLGWRLNGFGEGSFGWADDRTGSALWIVPSRNLFVVVLSNANHPMTKPAADVARRRDAFLLKLREAIGPDPHRI